MDTKKNKYLIYTTTYWCWVTQYFVGMIAPIFIMIKINPVLNLATYLVSFALLNIFIWFIVRKYLLQPIEITLTEERIYLKYLSFNLKKTKKEVSTSIDKISGFSDFTVNQELKFKLYFLQGQTFTLHKYEFWSRTDDFEQLVNDFKIYIEDSNDNLTFENNRIPNKKIKYGDNTYLNFGLYCLSIALILGLSLFLSRSNETNTYNWIFGFLIIIAFGIFYLLRQRKTKSKIKNE